MIPIAFSFKRVQEEKMKHRAELEEERAAKRAKKDKKSFAL
jgi:hypothetical protein